MGQVNRFEARNISSGEVPAPRHDIWEVLSSPDRLAQMTPLLDGISVHGDVWCWRLSGISTLGVEVAPSFTERMTFEPETTIRFAHEPQPGAPERGGADGVYTLHVVHDGLTRLEIDINLHVLLPLPQAARRAVQRVMTSTMTRTGDVFAKRLYEQLGLDPSTAAQETVWA